MQIIYDAVEKHRQLILDTQDYIWKNPETGYREIKTSKYMEDVFKKLGYNIVKAENIPGFYTIIDTGRPGPEVLILSELDALICPEHPDADKKSGAAHCCGHSAQCAAMAGIAGALKDEKVLEKMCGKIRLCVVPAEELIEIDYRKDLREKGIIKYCGGKTEFLSRGYFDGVDLAFMVHMTEGRCFGVGKASVGCLAKKVVFKGKSAHAGGAPWLGCNALYAATLGLQAINSVRETFQEKDVIRVHPIITQGGGAVNAIPDTVCIESYVRGSSFEAITAANRRVNQALCGAALSLGANIDIQDMPGYAPYEESTDLIKIAEDALKILAPEQEFWKGDFISSGSTDMGDLHCIMPIIHAFAPGAKGVGHSPDYQITDKETALITNAKWQVVMLALLLKDGGARAKEILKNYKKPFSGKEEYLSYLDTLFSSGDRIVYNDDGSAHIKL